ncbi:MAG: hypothetical protein R6U50_16930 [Desulfobacterales bacterium]
MDIFDDTIAEIRQWYDKRRPGGNARSYTIADTGAAGIRSASGKRDSAVNIILKEDTYLELGHPSAGSCSASLATRNADLVVDGRITLTGPDILEMHHARSAFGQIIIAAIPGLTGMAESQATAVLDETASKIDRIAYASAQDDGYMIRSVPNVIWARVSKDAARRGFSLKHLGARVVEAVKYGCDGVSACEIYFATGAKGDIEQLDDILDAARAKRKKLETFTLRPDGDYECTQEQDCRTCPEQVVCDNIRDVINIRKGDRVITFGKDEVTIEKHE